MQSINPATEEILKSFELHTQSQIDTALQDAASMFRQWRRTTFAERASLMQRSATYLRQHGSSLAAMITAEMGKPIAEAEAEVAKCALNCGFYAEHSQRFLQDEARESTATESYIQYTPLGVILAVMPWNFPFWQVFRFAAPALMAAQPF
jgi:acyl-CoA reductase-like NAD-dependent aldehyde dehydrogenase